MSFFNFKYLNSLKVAFGWLDTSNRVKNPMALGFSQNITEYWAVELKNYNVDIFCNSDIDVLIEQAAIDLNNKFFVINSVGTFLANEFAFIDQIILFLQNTKHEDITIVGHILDKKENFYELHHQTIIINLDWWRKANKPKFGQENDKNKDCLLVDRSVENWHDDYTPLWIQKNKKNVLVKYNNLRFGWNIINEALKENKKIYSFNKVIRESKKYLYPEVTKDFIKNKNFIVNKLQTDVIYISNTETPPDITWKDLGFHYFDAIAIPAGGLSPLINAFCCNLKEGGKVCIYDISPNALDFQCNLINKKINLTNLKNDIKILKKDHFNYKNYNSNTVKRYTVFQADTHLEKMQNIVNNLIELGLQDYYDKVWPNLEKIYLEIDLFDVDRFHNILNEFPKKHEKVFLNFSNIFSYQNTAFMYSSLERLNIEKNIIKIMTNYGKNKFYFRSMGGNGIKVKCDLAETILDKYNYYTKDFLKVFPWIKI
tara:strand:- start:660 stop:2111 length:1452 start_codon:yes stop_codon:yes gene_type:complete